MIEKLCIVGVGLIGGSLARALRAAKHARTTVGYGRDPKHLQRAVKLGVIDHGADNLAAAIKGADMVVLAAPVGALPGLLRDIAPSLATGAVVTDVGSVKAGVIDAARVAFGKGFARFVPGHPIAGTEKSGVEASFDSLFSGQRVVLTPVDETDPQAVARVTAMWRAAGAEVSTMSAERHDEVLAAASHLPHMLAYTLIDCLLKLDGSDDVFALAASSFRDATRVAASDPVMWRDICLSNKAALTRILKHYRTHFDGLIAAIENGDGDAMQAMFARAKKRRDALKAKDQGSSD